MDSGGRRDSQIREINIPILQCNLNKAHGAQVELLNKINKLKSYIALITEPYCYKYKLSIPPKKSLIIPNKKTGQPRAAIFCSNNLLMTELTSLNHRDMAVGLIKLDNKDIMIISLYCDIKEDAVPEFLKTALDYGEKRGYSILMGANTNAHSKMWGHETNNRGAKFENLIQDYDLQLHNVGWEFTFECKTGRSVIDIALSRNLKLKIEDWKVCKTYNHSDHNTVRYNIKTDIIEIKPHRQYDTADWDSFKAALQQYDLQTPKIINQEKLERMVNKLNKCIATELDKICPILPTKIINRNNPWWTEQLNQMRKELFSLYDKSKINADNMELYKLKLKTYRKNVAKNHKKMQEEYKK